MMLILSILVFILLLGNTVFFHGSLMGGILGMALSGGSAVLAVLLRKKPQKKALAAGCVLLLVCGMGAGILFPPATGSSGADADENPVIKELTQVAVSGETAKGKKMAEEYAAAREKEIAEDSAPDYLPEDDTVQLLLAQCCLVAGDAKGAEEALREVKDKKSQGYYLQYGELARQEENDISFLRNWQEAVGEYPQWEISNLMYGICMVSVAGENGTRYMDDILSTAFFFLGRAYDINPENPYTSCYLGVANCMRSNYQLAITYLEQAQKLDNGEDEELTQTIADYIEFTKKEGELE